MERDIKKIVSQMTLEEKAGMLSGESFWKLKTVDRLNILSMRVSDGPHGLRKTSQDVDTLGIFDTKKATCFPAACSSACSFDKDLLHDMGDTLGKECQAEDVAVLLGPGINMKRSPLCGRNFEYYSEDPYLAGELGAAYVAGVQSNHIGTSLKHFAANNQEYRRMSCSSEVDERTLREIYLSAFEIVIKKAKPWTVMCSYNMINGVFSSDNKKLLTDVLRNEWGYEGFVMSDWGAVNNRVKGVKAGLDLEMPGSHGVNDIEIINAVQSGNLDESLVDLSVSRILSKIYEYNDNRMDVSYNLDTDHEKAREVAENSIVLLKNENVLPLNTEDPIAFIGAFAKEPRFQGGGSSNINAYKVQGAYDSAQNVANISYAEGYHPATNEYDEEKVIQALNVAKEANVAVVFAGLPDIYESEAYDREHMSLPMVQNDLISRICEVQPNTVVVLHNGAPVEMPWIHQVKGIVEVYLGGEAVGEATANILFGKTNPSGKLAETFPLKLEDNPTFLNFLGDGKKVHYSEGIFIGYRYYDTKKMDVLFPFGYGLSYTSFQLDNISVNKDYFRDDDTILVSVDVTNTGHRTGKEVVQVYIKDKTNATRRPEKELKGFEKVELAPGETKTIIIPLDKRSFAWYNEEIHDWYVASGKYEILVGTSSRNIAETLEIEIAGTLELPWKVTELTVLEDILANPLLKETAEEFIGKTFQTTNMTKGDLLVIANLPLRSLRSFFEFSNQTLQKFIDNMNSLL